MPEFERSAFSPYTQRQQAELIPEPGCHDRLSRQAGIAVDGNLVDAQFSALASCMLSRKSIAAGRIISAAMRKAPIALGETTEVAPAL